MKRAVRTWRLIFKRIVAVLLAGGLFAWGGACHYDLSLLEFGKATTRVVAGPMLAWWHNDDLTALNEELDSYYHGIEIPVGFKSPAGSWDAVSGAESTIEIRGTSVEGHGDVIPFVYESPSVAYLSEFSARYALDEIAGEGTEYQRMLRLFAWLGTRWDHGVDAVPGGAQMFHPIDAVAAGEKGARFWCETAARLTVHAATAMGWPARLMSASKDGYHWHHALAEIWSNQFNKWFLVDNDYNILYEKDGQPLSGYELCHKGPDWQKKGVLQVRRLAPLKPALREVDLLPFYRYVHVDMRNDWRSRRLPAGSPAGGDLATWWTARDDFGPILTGKICVNDPRIFDWKVNSVEIYVLGIEDSRLLKVGLRGYSPYFSRFDWRLEGEEWRQNLDGMITVPLVKGKWLLQARIMTVAGDPGPLSELELFVK